ncbi:MAG: hypothetical protein WDA09_09575 [Bacteriovoracaceae bacterium]
MLLKFFLFSFTLLISQFSFGRTGLYVEAFPLKEGYSDSLRFGDFSVSNELGFNFHHAPTCVSSDPDFKVTEKCPFIIDYFIEEKIVSEEETTKTMLIRVDSISESGVFLYIKVNDQLHKIDRCGDGTYSYCTYRYYDSDKSLKTIDEKDKFYLSYLLAKEQKPLVELPAIPDDYSKVIPFDQWSDAPTYYEMKGLLFNISSYHVEWSPHFYRTPDLKEITLLQDGLRSWNSTYSSGITGLQLHMDFLVARIDPNLNWVEVIGKPNAFLDIRECKNKLIECRFLNLKTTAYEKDLKVLEDVKKYKLSPYLNHFIEELLPCVESRNEECIRKFFVQSSDLRPDPTDVCIDQSFSFPHYSFTSKDIDILKECLKYENLLPTLYGTKATNDHICAFAPRWYLAKDEFKLIGILHHKNVLADYNNYKDRFFLSEKRDDLSFFWKESVRSVFDKDRLERMELEELLERKSYVDVQEEILKRLPVGITRFDNFSLHPEILEKLALKVYRFYDYLPKEVLEDPYVKRLALEYELFYQHNLNNFAEGDLLHPDFFQNKEVVLHHFYFNCSNEKFDMSYLDNNEKMLNFKSTFIKNLKSLEEIRSRCIPHNLLMDPDILSELKKKPQWYCIFLPKNQRTRCVGSYSQDSENRIIFDPRDKNITLSLDFQRSLFSGSPWLIKSLSEDFAFNLDALVSGLENHYIPEILFRKDQLEQPIVKDFLAKRKRVSRVKYEDYLQELSISSAYLFEIISPYLLFNEEFHLKKSKGGDGLHDTSYLVNWAHKTPLSENVQKIIVEYCHDRIISTDEVAALLKLDWVKGLDEFKSALEDCKAKMDIDDKRTK